MFSKIKENYEFYKKQYFRGKDIYCPFCNSTVEERTILLFLQAKTEMLSGEPKILIITEEGKITEYFKNFPNSEIKSYSSRSDFIIRDEHRKQEYETASFDIIVCNYIKEFKYKNINYF